MAVFAISDLHLPGGDTKPMDVFGEHWKDHFEKISADWNDRVTARDIVLLPGDLSWAMSLEDAKPDLQAVGALPGRKIILRGNHDFWWSGIGRVRAALPEARAFHMSGKKMVESAMQFRREGVPMGLPGLDEWHIPQTDADAVRAAKAALLQ